MATTASFSSTTGTLTELGDALDNTIATSRDAAGNILVNGGAVRIQGGSATVANTTLIQVFGQGGNDILNLDETRGALPAANMFGGDGNDVITGGSGNDQLFGQAGNDTLLGKGGNDFLFGGADNDTLTGGDGDDQVFGESGNDRMIWNPGDDNDLFEGGDGTDTAEVNGGNGAETFTIVPNGTRVRFDRITPAPFFIDIGTTENIVVNANGGDDVITAGNGLSTLVKLTIDGGTGNDTITGGDGDDMLIGGDGNDVIRGGRGNDTARLGAGDDIFIWNPGDANDIVEGQDGTDTLQFNGANIAEKIDILANGSRGRFTRDVANITMDINGVEHVNFVALGGADNITVGDLSGTDITHVALDLSATPGSGVGDGAADRVTVTGTGGNDHINVTGAAGSVTVSGLAAQVSIIGAEGANDVLTVSAGAGNDVINAEALSAETIKLVIDGGAGNDTITGGQSAETLIGGDDNDTVNGGGGNDQLFGGAGNDTLIGGAGDDQVFGEAGDDRMIWNPGDGSDLFEGGDGTDTAEVNGGNGAETFTITTNGSRVRFDRITAAPFFIDIGTTENIVVNANGGDDVITASNGLSTLVKLTIDGGTGNDTITGGDGDDMLIGGDGNDVIRGGRGRGTDTARLGAGNDTFIWNPGDGNDTVEGEGGTDTLQFNGANIAEKIDITANGTRGRFTRDVANITMDINGVERVNFAALGGADNITVGDLSGSGITQVLLDLSATAGSGVGDGAADRVTVTGTGGNDQIKVSGTGSSVTVGGLATALSITGAEAANDVLTVSAGAGNDVISAQTLSPTSIKLVIDGGAGNDTINGGQGANTLIGGDGNDTVNGGVGNEQLFGGNDNDKLIGGAGDDQVFGEAGDDRMIWNPGDGNDLFEGGDGVDTAEVNGGDGAETFTITANGTRVRLDRLTDSSFLDIGSTENIVVTAKSGDDVITAGNGLATLTKLTIDGGAGNDTITGGDGADMLIGGDGNDVIRGGRGNDTAQLGAGDDTFIWNPGDGSDTVEGQAGTDTLQFNGANIAEKIDITANGTRGRFTRDVAAITMDINGVEHVNFTALGGADNITVGDLSRTGITQVALDLSATPGSGVGDGAADHVTVTGTAGGNHIQVAGTGSSVTITGLASEVSITGAEGANDLLTVSAGAGNDVINAQALSPESIKLAIDGGAGNDTITGSHGADTLSGGDGNDTIIWNPGDGSDVVEGGDGTDTLVFGGSNAAERIDVLANGGRVLVARDVGSVAMDVNGIEKIQINAFGSADNITVGDLTGTGVTQVAIDLAAVGGGGDMLQDTVTVNGTAGNDTISVVKSGTSLSVKGLSEQVTIANAEADDALVINGGFGTDIIDASSIKAGVVKLTLNGGEGDDLIKGSQGDDLVNGGRGNDTALLGAGNDTFVWNPGDNNDIVEGQAGTDTLLFNGANINEKFDISANGGRIRMTRDVANITMDTNDVENIQLNTFGGVDLITIGDLTGTDIKQINLDLGGLDGSPDTVVINATSGDDVVVVASENGVVTVSGLGETVTIRNFDANDRIVIKGLAGNDVIEASGLEPGILLTVDGGDGDDVMVGGAGNDTLLGGAGDDVLIGGPGQDVLDGGTGSNLIIQDGGRSLAAAPVIAPPPVDGAALLRQFMASSFVSEGEGHGATPLSDPQASQPPMLTMPQHA